MSRYLTEAELAAELSVNPGTLRSWRARGEGPPFLRLSARVIRYDAAAVAAWCEARVATPAPADELSAARAELRQRAATRRGR